MLTTPKKCFQSDVLVSLAKAVAFIAVFIGYAQIEDESKVEFRFGLIVTALMFILIAAPLVHLGEIFETKSTEILPFPLIFMATIVTFQWLLYGLIVDNGFIIFQNAVGFVICAAELSLFAIFPSKPDPKKTN
ncbi:sugar transporter SWEET1-like [Belonocnema kinseyi]|uniref:sugar transporter SWEET1-like n=1 Tax=Belonocnema kinseyi TaxID=2817044 RepID=UPI00143D81CF|nr:sugar transporter SWEET1-like [Belonocnema kinseyi]